MIKSNSRSLFWFAASLALLPVIGRLIYFLCGLIGDNLPFTPLFLPPIMMTAWFSGRVPAFIVAIATVATLYLSIREFAHVTAGLYVMLNLQFITYIMVAFLASSLRKTLDHERSLARTDDLTGLLNHRAFYEIGLMELRRARRYGRPLSCLVMDVDRFKDINDRLGHATGDHALKLLGESLRQSLRLSDVAVRIGGDEFCVLLPETDADGAQTVIVRVQKQIAIVSFDRMTISIGCSTFTDIPETVDDLLRVADAAMYVAKAKGGGRVEFVVIDQAAPIPKEVSP